MFIITLTGYTFAGKTTLFNSLTKESLPIGTDLFTTLSTTTRGISVGSRKVLLSDTVGFIDKLPHMLMDAFYSTLEEVTLADLVVLVLDASDPMSEFLRKLDTCISTLNSLGVFRGSILPVLNKIEMTGDLMAYREEVIRLLDIKPVEISAKTGEGLSELLDFISSRLPQYEQFHISIPARSNIAALLSWAFEKADVKSIKYGEKNIDIEIQMLPAFVPHLKLLLSGFESVSINQLPKA